MTILEIGVGNGYIANELAKAGHRVVGMDLFDEPLGTLSPEVERIKFDIERQDVPDELRGKFDVILALAILEHVWKEDEALSRMKVMLKTGGTLYASTPNINWWPFRIKYFLGKTVDDFHTCDHVKFWNLSRFAKVIREAGFSITKQFTSTGIPNLIWPFVRKGKGNKYEIAGKWLFVESDHAHPLLGYNQVVVATPNLDELV